MELSRRKLLLSGTGATNLVAIAGCTSNDNGGTNGEENHDDHADRNGGSEVESDFTPIDRSIEGLSDTQATEEVRLEDGDTYTLNAEVVRHDPGIGNEIAMYAYNGQIPGPTLRVPQGAEIDIAVVNNLPYETTVHWHGLRLDIENDGVPDMTQDPIDPDETFEYTVEFPDEGVFWYHPHLREDLQQNLGLRGAIIVEGPREDEEEWPHEEIVTLSDLKIVDDDVYPLWEESVNHAMMGRFGNRLLTNGANEWSTEADSGERVRLHLLNVANARPFQISAKGADRMELIGLDGGFLPKPDDVSGVLLSPSERATVDILMPEEGDVRLVNTTPHGENELGLLESTGTERVDTLDAPMEPHQRAEEDLAEAFAKSGEPVDITWELDIKIDHELHEMMDMDDMDHEDMDDMDHEDGPPPIEWEDDMEDINEISTNELVTHIIRDQETGNENMDIEPVFDYDSFGRIKIKNLPDTEHPMQHPIHLHGVHFLVDTIDGEPNPHPSWKDTVHVSAGSEVVITVPMSNPGAWLAHCHINEHLEADMKATFTVKDP
ncbi:multicopper oxidase family protein (plasmid) [Natrinema zhouii]|uniref:multicopper oxidase family protein n=1 Tax=Natrinema zhouii TaxID=1710539 RepID=UPI001CFFEE77|nr:multicopper oxidase family protein [Natrinema zhouii]UHQ99144.1 multicopper oxidase family protein [Natrinema zhouii]